MACTEAHSLKRYLQSLPQIDRYILLLSYADGLTPLEVGMVLDISASAVERKLGVLTGEARAVIQGLASRETQARTASALCAAP